MNREEILQAKQELIAAMQSPNMFLALAEIWGEPVDPVRDVSPVIEKIADVTKTEPGVDVYYFDVSEDDKEVYYIDYSGTVTTLAVRPDSPSAVSFQDILTKEYRVAFSDLLAGKYDLLAKKKKAIARALDNIEVKRTLMVVDAAVPVDNRVLLGTNENKFRYPHLVALREKVKDYADNFVLIVGSQIDHDMILWEFDENKYHSVNEMAKDMSIEVIRVVGKVKVDNVEKVLLNANKALLVGLNTEGEGRPVKFSRRKIAPVEIAGGQIDTAKERAIIVTPAVFADGTARRPSVAAVGFESMAVVSTHSLAQAGFYRGSSWTAEA